MKFDKFLLTKGKYNVRILMIFKKYNLFNKQIYLIYYFKIQGRSDLIGKNKITKKDIQEMITFGVKEIYKAENGTSILLKSYYIVF